MSDLLHSVVIATCGRDELLARALESVRRQSVSPDRIVVVEDGTADPDRLHRLGSRLGLTLEALVNRRTRGASGAWNTALDHLARSEPDPDRHLVSMLDDDDCWEYDYLEKIRAAARSGADVMAATLSRRDDRTPDGRLCSPPSRLQADDFLAGNRGIQGSNLSARLSILLMAGLFDEALTSCTDRDICIRLADLRPTYLAVPAAVAHHDTLHGSPRLSDRASPGKLQGLDAFHAKWRRRMTDEQFRASAERGHRLFGWSPSDCPPHTIAEAPPRRPGSRSPEPLSLVVGIIVDGSRPERCRPLLDGLRKFSQHLLIRSMDVVLLENGDAAGFGAVAEHGRAIGLTIWAVDIDAQRQVAPGLALRDGDVSRHKPIAVARTLLQRFVFHVSQARNGAPAWILDDDFRLPDDMDELAEAMAACRDSGIHVALGGNSGAAPVPASSLLRTQLVDIVHFLGWAALGGPGDPLPDADDANRRWLTGRRDYHYDLTRDCTDRLETPFLPHFQGATLQEAASEVLRKAERVLAGEAISRPVLPAPATDPKEAPDSCLRGGNTLVLDTTLLRDIPNMSPRIDGRPTRRSDMIWAANARYRFDRTVKSVRLPMIHDRSMEQAGEDDSRRLIDDILGYGFFRAYERALKREGRRPGAPLTEEERERVTMDTRKYALERLASYRLSFWRSMGLVRVLENMSAAEPWWLRSAHSDERTAFSRFLDLSRRTTDIANLRRIEDGIRTGLEVGEFTAFLAGIERLHPDRPAPDDPFLLPWVERGREEQARALLRRHLGTPADTLLGMGAEGVVLRLGDRVVKVFDRWTAKQRRETAPIVAALRDRPTNGALPEVLTVHDWPEAFAVEYRFEESEPYPGGHGPGLVAMLADLRHTGWVHSNVSPGNLRVTARGLQLIDVGRSLEFATPRGAEMMIRRAFLSWRFAGRADLAAVMRASLETELLPELTGWRALLEAVESDSSKIRLDRHMRGRAEALAPRKVLDYGCGKPRDAARWAEACHLTAYDIDPGLPERWLRDAPNVPFWSDTLLKAALTKREIFDLVVCSLVLCAVGDASMATILDNIRRLAGRDGRVLVAVCDPAALHVTHAVDQTRHGTRHLDALLPASYRKSVASSPTCREEFHRSTEAYRRAFARAGLRILDESAVNGFDAEHLERIPEFLVFELSPLPELRARTSLLIKLCAMEAGTALHQVRHLERQLARPRAFDEIVLLVDPHEGPFPRAYHPGDLVELRRVTDRLQAEGVVDRIIDGFVDGPDAAAAARRWTGQEAHRAHCANGQPAASILAAIEGCVGDYVLHIDADVLVARPDPSFDHIADAVRVFEENPDAVTLALPVKGDNDPTPRRLDLDSRPFRTETMAGWIAKSRLLALRPLPGGATAGRLDLPWHRMLDIAIGQGRAASLRRGSTALWFAAPDNGRKYRVDDHLLLLDRMEAGSAPAVQEGKPLVQGSLAEWLGPKRAEPLVVVVCGRNVRPGAIERCMSSLRAQSHGEWGVIVVDDASDDGSDEVLARACRRLGDRATLVRRRRRVGLLANTFLAVRHLVGSPDAVIVLLDLDDALADPGALESIARQHRKGADLTVGSMLRTDKTAMYPVDFIHPRGSRGGNVWQHLRTFRKRLFDRIAPEDLKLDGQWIDLANDWAFMIPMAEMAENPVWMREVLYLHEPSTGRPVEEKAKREAVIARIVAKPSYRNRPQIPPRVTVLCYRRVLEHVPKSGPDALFHRQGMAVTRMAFRSQLREALHHFEPIRASDLLAAQRGELALPENSLLVTVDGGYRDFATSALPLLGQMGIEPVLFARLPSADGFPSWAPLDLLRVGRGLARMDPPSPDMEWCAHLQDLPSHRQLAEVRNHIGPISDDALAEARQVIYLSDEELRSLRGVVLGTHGTEQVRWTDLTDGELEDMLARCRAWLDQAGGTPMAAYPGGEIDERVAARLAETGYQAAFTTDAVPCPVPPAFALRRIIMPDDGDYIARLIESRQEEAA